MDLIDAFIVIGSDRNRLLAVLFLLITAFCLFVATLYLTRENVFWRGFFGHSLPFHWKRLAVILSLTSPGLLLPAGLAYVANGLDDQLTPNGFGCRASRRAACRARSAAEFVAKMGIVEEECDECLYWMELLVEAGLVPQQDLSDLMSEANELLAITIASIKTARKRKGRGQ